MILIKLEERASTGFEIYEFFERFTKKKGKDQGLRRVQFHFVTMRGEDGAKSAQAMTKRFSTHNSERAGEKEAIMMSSERERKRQDEWTTRINLSQ